ncbi:MAG TPA: glycosyltransferase family 2 protein [Pirellulales bacterium]|nr:glycosyltransferase family 2 protein [Pirellulales bacterium]
MPTLVSIVVPTHNELGNVDALYNAIRDVFDKLPDYTFELIYCDDSTDATPDRIAGLHASDSRVKLIRLSRRFSQSIAICAGLNRCRGQAVILMDADLQDSPGIIPEMLRLWREGNQIVYVERQSASNYWLYQHLAKSFYRLLERISSIEIPRDAGEFRLLDASVVAFLKRLTEHTRFLRGLTVWPGMKQARIATVRQPRHAGTTNYNFRRSLTVAIDGFVSFSVVPLRLAAVAGAVLCAGSAGLGVVSLVAWLAGLASSAGGWSSVMLSLWFLAGVQLLFVGILGEYLGRVFIEVQNRPLYWTAYELGFQENPALSGHHLGRTFAEIPS